MSEMYFAEASSHIDGLVSDAVAGGAGRLTEEQLAIKCYQRMEAYAAINPIENILIVAATLLTREIQRKTTAPSMN